MGERVLSGEQPFQRQEPGPKRRLKTCVECQILTPVMCS
jgi:hypothetical protein